ncbi:hypothetical protein PCNPT3_00080 [Psychromonas sp. CNPT3]|nr:hypothetical protein PCNPT3_00080 [Psychromonas sp. CNPT3]
MLSSSKIAFIWLAFIASCALTLSYQIMQPKLPIETNILALLPKDKQDPLAQKAFERVADNLSNKVVFLLQGDDKQRLLSAAEDFSAQLLDTKLFVKVQAKVDELQQRAWGKLYFPFRSQLLTESQKIRLKDNPEKQVEHVISQLYNPFSGVSGTELGSDPFLLFRDYLSEKNQQTAQFTLLNGFISTKYQGKTYIVIQADLLGDAYDTQLQSHIGNLIALEKTIENKFHVKLMHTGTLFYAAYGTQSAKSEISTIGIGSLLGIIFLLLWVYRSTLPLLLALLSIGCGLLVAFVVSVAVFGKVHLFSLVFGASLIGVSIDYAFHYLTERLKTPHNWDSQKALKHIFSAITLGLITSLMGYLGLLAAPFPGLQQLSLFSVIGLISAYLTVICCYPYFSKKPSTITPPKLMFFIQWLNLWHNPKLRLLLPLGLFVFALLGLTQVHFNDDIRQLQAMPVDLKEQEQQIKKITGVGEKQQLLLVKSNTEENLLIALETLDLKLKEWKKQGVISSYRSIHQFVPSLKTQRENYQLVQSLYIKEASLLQERLNFSAPVILNVPFSPFLIKDFLASPVSAPLGFLWLGNINQNIASIVILSDVKNKADILRYIEDNAALTSLDKADEISTIFGVYRVYISMLLGSAYLLICCLLLYRYTLKLACKVIIPPLIAGCVGLAITSVFGIPITIFNLLALLLILGIGIDYTLFFAELKKHADAPNTLLAITLSAITTVLSFGLLALSATAAIHGFGITVLSGIVVAWLLAPLAMPLKSKTENMKIEHEKTL